MYISVENKISLIPGIVSLFSIKLSNPLPKEATTNT